MRAGWWHPASNDTTGRLTLAGETVAVVSVSKRYHGVEIKRSVVRKAETRSPGEMPAHGNLVPPTSRTGHAAAC